MDESRRCEQGCLHPIYVVMSSACATILALVVSFCGLCMSDAKTNITTPAPDLINYETILRQKLLAKYDPVVLPGLTRNGVKDKLRIDVRFSLNRILTSDDRMETLSVMVWYHETWFDPGLVWNPADYGNITMTRFDPNTIWTSDAYVPNLALINPEDKRARIKPFVRMQPEHPEAANVSQWTYALFEDRCTFDMSYFPFDHQQCQLCVDNLHYFDDIVYVPAASVDCDNYVEGGQWDLINATGSTHRYSNWACFNVTIQRRSIYYVVNLFLPTLTVCVLNTIGLFAGVASEHASEVDFSSLGQTTLLSLGVMLLTVADQTPKGAAEVSLLGHFFLCMIWQTLLAAITALCLKRLYRKTQNSGKPGTEISKVQSFVMAHGPKICMALHLALIAAIIGVILGKGNANQLMKTI